MTPIEQLKQNLQKAAEEYGAQVLRIVADFEVGVMVTEIGKPLNDPAFLAEMKQPVPLASEQVVTPEIPDLNDLPETKSFEQDPEWELVLDADERYNKLVAYLIEKGMTAQDLEQFQTTRKVRFQTNFHAHLGNVIWYREELLKPGGGVFSLRDILNQTDTTEDEKPMWQALAKSKGLK